MTLIFCTASCQGPRTTYCVEAHATEQAKDLLRTSTKGISRRPCHRVYSSRLTVSPAHTFHSLSQIAHHSHHSTRFEAQRSRYISLTCVTLTLQISGPSLRFPSHLQHHQATTPKRPHLQKSILYPNHHQNACPPHESYVSHQSSRVFSLRSQYLTQTSLTSYLHSNCNNNGYYYDGNDCYYSSPWSNWGRWYAFTHA